MTPQPHFEPANGPAGGALRASDAERERTAAALRRHHVDGRLDTDELQERLGRCYAARTQADLRALLADLPPERPAAPRPRRSRDDAAPVLAALLVVVALAATLAAVHHGHPGPLPLLAVFLLLRLGRGPRRGWTAGGTRV